MISKFLDSKDELDRFSWSKEDLQIYESVDMKISADKAIHDTFFEKGLEKGKNIQARETILNMHKMGMNIDTLSKATSLTHESVEKNYK